MHDEGSSCSVKGSDDERTQRDGGTKGSDDGRSKEDERKGVKGEVKEVIGPSSVVDYARNKGVQRGGHARKAGQAS